ncbi:MAG: hypothetical protein MUF42_06725 [Cytophagaceae bacterium]|nr:hypothetical protein [Cytophagaceae bacterium]
MLVSSDSGLKLFLYASIVVFLGIHGLSFSQVPKNLWGLRNPGKEQLRFCSACQKTLANMPPDVHYGTFIQDGKMYFTIDNPEWFFKIFSGKWDGFAFDIIRRDQYECGRKVELANSWAYRGTLLKPMYRKNMEGRMFETDQGYLVVEYADLPPGFDENSIECNLLILKNKYLCHYANFYDLRGQKWQLLKMPLLMDSITDLQHRQRELLFKKDWKFIIPFEKNKIEYAAEDVKPLYDSLLHNDFSIKSIRILAFSSVEGPLENNIRLQESRAQSIVQALQSFQVGDSIPSHIEASENWVEFFDDIDTGPYSAWKSLSKEEIKKRLEDRKTSYDLEKYLKNHRKAILQLELQKKVSLNDTNPLHIKKAFQRDLDSNRISQALKLQYEIFENIEAGRLKDSIWSLIDIPEKPSLAALLLNREVFSYNRHTKEARQAEQSMVALQKLMPSNTQLQFNLAVIRVQLLYEGDTTVDADALGKQIAWLQGKVPNNRYLRLMINYSIMQCERFQKQRNYSAKDKAIQYIYKTCPSLVLSDEDALSLSKFYVAYSKYDWAEAMLLPFAKRIDALEDLIFFYINLTIVKPRVTSTNIYRTIMLNAINRNRSRFCKLFDPFGKGGISFQLLESEYLRKTYCENCLK